MFPTAIIIQSLNETESRKVHFHNVLRYPSDDKTVTRESALNCFLKFSQ